MNAADVDDTPATQALAIQHVACTFCGSKAGKLCTAGGAWRLPHVEVPNFAHLSRRKAYSEMADIMGWPPPPKASTDFADLLG